MSLFHVFELRGRGFRSSDGRKGAEKARFFLLECREVGFGELVFHSSRLDRTPTAPNGLVGADLASYPQYIGRFIDVYSTCEALRQGSSDFPCPTYLLLSFQRLS